MPQIQAETDFLFTISIHFHYSIKEKYLISNEKLIVRMSDTQHHSSLETVPTREQEMSAEAMTYRNAVYFLPYDGETPSRELNVSNAIGVPCIDYDGATTICGAKRVPSTKEIPLNYNKSIFNLEAAEREMRDVPKNEPSLCLIHVFANLSKSEIQGVMEDTNLGEIDSIDMAPVKSDKTGKKYRSVFVHFKSWNDNPTAIITRASLLYTPAKTAITIPYKAPWFWKAIKSNYTSNKSATKQTKQTKQTKRPASQHDINLATRMFSLPIDDEARIAFFKKQTPEFIAQVASKLVFQLPETKPKTRTIPKAIPRRKPKLKVQTNVKQDQDYPPADAADSFIPKSE